MERCKLHGAQRIKLPEKNDKKCPDKIIFTKTEFQLRLPFVMYADFKYILFKHNICKVIQINHGEENISVIKHVGMDFIPFTVTKDFIMSKKYIMVLIQQKSFPIKF